MKRAILLSLILVAALLPTGVRGAEAVPYSGAGCAGADEFFADEVWAKVAAESCLKCHKDGGDAEDSKLVLLDPARATGSARAAALGQNRDALARMARVLHEGQSRLLRKATGQIKHEGKDAVKPDSAEQRMLAEFIRRVNSPVATAPAEDKDAPPFFAGVAMMDDRRLLRRVTLSLAGRLPTGAEWSALESDGLPSLLDAVMREDAFYERLREGFNDVFLTLGLDEVDNAGTSLDYEHFGKTRLWFQKFDLSHIEDKKEQEKARRKLTADERKAMSGEPMKLIEYIVRNDRALTEIVTADYVMVTPYTARSYGIYEELKPEFKNADDPFEYIPVKLKALVSKNETGQQDSATGFYPHAGLLSTFHYLRRYPTTETNRNRLRARMYFQHFLGIDVLALAARVTDAAAVSAKYENPTMEASECVVCHKTLDPVAGLFQDFWRFDSGYGRRKGGWFTDMFGAGFEGEDLPAEERWRALQWLGERTAKDPRFAATMVGHAYYILTGRRVLLPPKDLEDPLYHARWRAYRAQRNQIEEIATRFAQSGFNFKSAIKDWIASDFYRADGLALAAGSEERRVELEDIGVVRMLAPEQLERKLAAVFGQAWGKLDSESKLDMLYGGIDSKAVTERATDPSGAMGAIQRILSNDVARKQTALDFALAPSERRLFPDIEPSVTPGTSPEDDAKIRRAIAHLHERVLGRADSEDAPEVTRTFQLFTGILSDAAARKEIARDEKDPSYTIRAWRGVVTFLLRQQEFLYE